MSFRPAAFDTVALKLAPLLENLPPRLIAIDGRMGAGKSTLGRFLSWYFNVTLVETDPYLVRDGTFARHTEEISRIVSFRLEEKERPVLIEGVGMRELLEQLQRSADAHVYVENKTSPYQSSAMELAYETKYGPRQAADILAKVAHDG
jgi:adenylate kinase family enzyme